jgi:acyl-CoA synthetase (AMP-forming)/AMP-acid ligase II/7-keto-8-aminopelargonate synthetase-like enzyme/acyl carrier protein
VAYTFLRDDWPDESRAVDRLTFSELASAIDALAAHLMQYARPGDRAILLYPSGMEFIVAFLACLRAGVVAVPANAPRKERHLSRLLGIFNDCAPRLVLTTGQIVPLLASVPDFVPGGACILTTESKAFQSPGGESQFPSIDADTIAFLQYTSGSTGDPKGVIVTNANLAANEEAIESSFGHSPKSVQVGWLPLFHDMGLVGNVLQPLYVGYHSVLMSPESFLRAPARWLRAISEFRATTSGAPNFAYDHCARVVSEAEKQGLNLSSWQVAFNGAEPVRASTLDNFQRAFASCGFRQEAWFPCYGLAESTLFVSGGPAGQPPRLVNRPETRLAQRRLVDAQYNEQDRRLQVGCGRAALGVEIRVVDPESHQEFAAGQIGMIVVRGPSVALGYWRRPEETHSTFGVRSGDSRDNAFLRTDDLGFLLDGQLFVTGRLKELMIINGRNIYPQDVEAVSLAAHPLCQGNAACFSIDDGLGERLVVVQELVYEGETRAADVIAAVKLAVLRDLDIACHDVVTVGPRTLPRTSSGKLRRLAIRQQYLNGTYREKNSTHCQEAQSRPTKNPTTRITLQRHAAETLSVVLSVIRDWASQKGITPESVSEDTACSTLGVDSLSAAQIGSRLTQALGVRLQSDSLYLLTTPREIAGYIEASAMRDPVGDRHAHADPRVAEIDQSLTKAHASGLALLTLDANERAHRTVRVEGRDLVNFVTCSYLGLESDSRIVEAVCQGARTFGASCIVSRAYLSNSQFPRLESLLGEVFDAYPVVTPSTTLAHLAFASVLLQSGDLVLLDQQSHNSMHLAAHTVAHKCEIAYLPHNDMGVLQARLRGEPSTRRVWYLGDGIYSMFGDAAPVDALVNSITTFPNLHVYLDDAHGMSTQGRHGRGYVLSKLECLPERMVVAVSLSKAFGAGCGGCLVMPTPHWQQKVRRCGNTLIFSSPMPPPMLAAAIASAQVHLSSDIVAYQSELAALVGVFRQAAQEAGLCIMSGTSSPVQFLHIGDLEATLAIGSSLKQQGYLANVCGYPAVAPGQCGIRFTIHRHLTLDDIQGVVAAIRQARDTPPRRRKMSVNG